MRLAGITVIISLITMPCAGMEISRVTGCAGGDVLKLRGDIVAGDYVKFRSYFGEHRRIAGLDLDSDGGSLHEGVRIAPRLGTLRSVRVRNVAAIREFDAEVQRIGR